MPKVCKDCGVVVNNMRKHKRRNRCARQHIRKKVKEVLKMTEGYENFPIPKPRPYNPEEDVDEDDEEDLIPIYKDVEDEDS